MAYRNQDFEEDNTGFELKISPVQDTVKNLTVLLYHAKNSHKYNDYKKSNQADHPMAHTTTQPPKPKALPRPIHPVPVSAKIRKIGSKSTHRSRDRNHKRPGGSL